MALNRIELDHALDRINVNGSVDQVHVWGHEMDPSFKLDSIVLKDLGTCKVPLSKEKVKGMFRKTEEATVVGGAACDYSTCRTVKSANILLPCKNFQSKSRDEYLSQSINLAFKKAFGLGIENARVSLDFHLVSLLICQPSDNFVAFKFGGSHPGAFGVFLLHLPYEQESSASACVKVVHNQKMTNHGYKGKQPYYLTILAMDNRTQFVSTSVLIKPSGKKPLIFLIYDLIWTNSIRLVRDPQPNGLFDFLLKVNQVGQALAGWENISLNRLILEQPRTMSEFKRSLKIAPLIAPETALLCIPTRHSYYPCEFQMENLKADDVRMVNLLKTAHRVDVNIVILAIEHENLAGTSYGPYQSEEDSKKVDPVIDWKKEAISGEQKTFSIHRWVQGDWVFPTMHKKYSCLRFDRHLVGDVVSVLKVGSYEGELAEETPKKRHVAEGNCSRNVTYHPAIVIRPRNAAILECWKYSPIRTVQCLSQRLIMALDCKHTKEGLERHVLVEEVNLILRLTTEGEHELSDCEVTAILHQLLYVCTFFATADEGLKVLGAIPKRQCNCRNAHKEGFEGFFGEKNVTLEDVVKCLVSRAGWQKCSTLLYAMYSRCEIDDYLPLKRLSCALNDIDCIDEAVGFAKMCLRILAEHDECEYVNQLDRDGIGFYIDLSVLESGNMAVERKAIYALLEKVALKKSEALHMMICGWFENLHYGEENLTDLKLSFGRLVRQIERYDEKCTVFSVICFACQTRNTELAKIVLSKFFSSRDGNEKSEFEEMLADHGSYYHLDHVEYLYKAIAQSSAAMKGFCKFIEDGMAATDLGILEACLFHLTAAEREPSMRADHQSDSFISIIKGMNIKTLKQVANVIIRHNDSMRTDYRISMTITSALLNSFHDSIASSCNSDIANSCNSDIPSLFTQETVDFSTVMYCFAKLANQFDTLGAVLTFRAALSLGFPGYDEFDLLEDDATDLLMESWLIALKVTIDDEKYDHAVIAYQTLRFFETHVKFTHDMPSQIIVEHFKDLVLPVAFLEKTLIALYDRERRRSGTCLKDDDSMWKLAQLASDMLTADPQMKTVNLNAQPEHIVKLMCSIFWTGSLSNEKLADLVCSLPSQKTRCYPSLFIASMDELQNCALSSASSFSALQKLLRHCIKLSFTDVDCASSWARHGATFLDCKDVTEFYQSEEKFKSFGPFATIEEANDFAKFASDGLPWADNSFKNNENLYYCEITKLYPVVVDAAHPIHAIGEFLHTLYNKFLCSIVDVSNERKCVVCLSR